MKKPTLFNRFLITNFILLILPLVGLIIFTNYYVFDLLERKAVDDRRRNLQGSSLLIEKQVEDLSKMAYQISSDTRFKSWRYGDNPFKAYQTLKVLGHYQIPNSFIDNLIIFNNLDSYFYTSRETYRLEVYMEMVNTFKKRDEADLMNVLLSNDKLVIWGQEDEDSHDLLIFRPYPFPCVTPIGQIIFLVKKEAIFSHFLINPRDILIIRDHEGKNLAYNCRDLLLRTFDDYFRENPGSRQFSYDQVDYHIVAHTSPNRGWTYISLIPLVDISSELIPLYRLYAAVTAVIILAGLILAYLFGRMNYAPIGQFKQFYKNLTGSQTSASDLESIRLSFKESWEERERLRNRVIRNRPAVMRWLLSDLLHGKITDENRLFSVIHDMGYDWNKPYFRVLQVLFNRGEAAKREKTIIDLFPGDWEVMSLVNLSDDRLILIINTTDAESQNIRNLPEYYLRDNADSITLGVSGVKDTPFRLQEAFLESSMALDYVIVEGKGHALFHDIIQQKDDFVYPVRILEKLRLSLLKGNRDEEKNLIDELLALLKQKRPSLFQLRRVYFNLVNLYMNFREGPNQNPDIFRLQEIDTFDELIEIINSFVRESRNIQQSQAEPDSVILSEVLQWVEEHYRDPNLSRSMIADEFSLSPSYLSILFKRYTQKNLSDFIQMLRLERVKELLRDTDMSINDIVGSVGYLDVSNFIRKFRIHEGVTPGEYRRRFSR